MSFTFFLASEVQLLMWFDVSILNRSLHRWIFRVKRKSLSLRWLIELKWWTLTLSQLVLPRDWGAQSLLFEWIIFMLTLYISRLRREGLSLGSMTLRMHIHSLVARCNRGRRLFARRGHDWHRSSLFICLAVASLSQITLVMLLAHTSVHLSSLVLQLNLLLLEFHIGLHLLLIMTCWALSQVRLWKWGIIWECIHFRLLCALVTLEQLLLLHLLLLLHKSLLLHHESLLVFNLLILQELLLAVRIHAPELNQLLRTESSQNVLLTELDVEHLLLLLHSLHLLKLLHLSLALSCWGHGRRIHALGIAWLALIGLVRGVGSQGGRHWVRAVVRSSSSLIAWRHLLLLQMWNLINHLRGHSSSRSLAL